MEFNFTENQILIQKSIKDFAEKNIKPFIMQWDEKQEFPEHVFKKMGELGLMGVLVPSIYGGSELGYIEYVIIVSELAKVCGSIALSVAAHNSLCTGHILEFGNEEQKQRWLPKLATGEWLGAWGLTEANNGSDAANLKTFAEENGNEYVLNGSKNFITHGKSCNIAVILARTGKENHSHAMTAFVVEKGMKGFTHGKKENKLGMRASETTEIILTDCRVPKENILGNVGEGFIQALKILDGGRISIAALSCGIAEGAFSYALRYATERKQFGKNIIDHQAIAFKLADMVTEIEAAKLLTFKAAYIKNQNLPVTRYSSMAKLFSSEVAVRCANEAVQIFGGYGFTKDYPVEKYYRDAKLCTIGEGTSEIQKIVISRHLVKELATYFS
jgi:alkylation response protein AidB-like acyl-CoA dehydrogenase